MNHHIMNISISQEIAECLKSYLDKTIGKEELRKELRALHTKMVEKRINMQPENHPYISVIHWVTMEMPDLAYNDEEIEYVYHALHGEEGYDLQHTYWFWKNKVELNETEARILDISRKYLRNYYNNTKFDVFEFQKSYIEEEDLRFIDSLYPEKYRRQEFRKAVEIPSFFISQMLKLVEAGQYCTRDDRFDSNRAVAQKLGNILSCYDNDLPVYCTVTLKNGVTTITVY